jgi:hypothetical protein
VSEDRRILLFKRRRSAEPPLRFQSRTGMFCCFKNCFTSPTVPVCLKFLGRGEWQAAGLDANGRKRFAPVSRTMGSSGI